MHIDEWPGVFQELARTCGPVVFPAMRHHHLQFQVGVVAERHHFGLPFSGALAGVRDQENSQRLGFANGTVKYLQWKSLSCSENLNAGPSSRRCKTSVAGLRKFHVASVPKKVGETSHLSHTNAH